MDIVRTGGEVGDRGWESWMASLTQWTWIWATQGDGKGQGSLVCCSPWGRKETDRTWRLNNYNTVKRSNVPSDSTTTLREGGGGAVAKSCPTLVTPRTVARQAPLSTGFSRQEYWSGLPFPSPGDRPDPGIKPASPLSPELAGGFLTTEPPGKPPDPHSLT